MVIFLNLRGFQKEFEAVNRSMSFSEEGFEALFEYLEELNPSLECDPISLDETYTEYLNIEDYNDDYCTSLKSFEEVENVVVSFGTHAIIYN